jgi:hypothetical protein
VLWAKSGHPAIHSMRPIIAVHRVETHAAVADMDQQPIAVMLELMRPSRTRRRFLGDSRLTGMDESGRRVQGPAARVTQYHAADIGLRRMAANGLLRNAEHQYDIRERQKN